MKPDFPFAETIILYIGLATIFIAIILFAVLFYQVAIRPEHQENLKPKKPRGKINKVFAEILKQLNGPGGKDDEEKTAPGCLNVLFKSILIVILIFIGVGIVCYGAVVQSFTSFSGKELVAELFCDEVDTSSYSMKMILFEKHGPDANRPQEFLLTGDCWLIRGDIIGIHLLGLKTMYKLTRIGGYFADVKNKQKSTPKEYSLIPEEEKPDWAWLYNLSYDLPFIKAKRRITVSQYPERGRTVRIYVTPLEMTISPE